MPSLSQLPEAVVAGPTDALMLEQSGQTRAVSVATLQSGLQPKLVVAQGTLIGRVSVNPGPPEPIGVGVGLAIASGALVADQTVLAPIASPSFTGNPTAPTPSPGDHSNAIATTGFVQQRLFQPVSLAGDVVGAASPFNSTQIATTLPAITTAGTYAKVTVNAKGQVIGGSTTLVPSDITGLTVSPVHSVAGQIGDVVDLSSGTVLAGSGLTPRALKLRAADQFNALDYGADKTGATDSGTAINNARVAAQAAGTGGLIRLPTGNYTINSGVYTVSNVSYELDGGTIIGGSFTLPGQCDAIVGNMGKAYTKYAIAPGAEFGLYSSMYVDPAPGNLGYEKAGIYSRVKSADATLSTGDRDVLALQLTADTANNVSLARLWGLDVQINAFSGSDAHMVGAELGLVNNGVAQPNVDQTNSKYGLVISNGGPKLTTAAMLIDSAGGQYQDGIFIKDTGLVGKAFRVVTSGSGAWADVASVDKAGNSKFQLLSAANVVTTGTVASGNGTAMLGADPNGNLTLGVVGASGTPYIDLNGNAVAAGYCSRIIASAAGQVSLYKGGAGGGFSDLLTGSLHSSASVTAVTAISAPVITGAQNTLDDGAGNASIQGGLTVHGTITGTLTGGEMVANKGAANGYASLDSTGKIPNSQIPASAILGAMQYQGAWNASTNSPALASSSGTKGYYYTVATAGATGLDGIATWNVGDHAVFNGSVWEKFDGLASEVITVAGRTGTVVLAVADIAGAAPLVSPGFTGVPTAPTAALADSSTTVATTAFVKGQGYVTTSGAASAAPVQSVSGRSGSVVLSTSDISGLGTMATQAAASVAISGGSINGAAVGTTTSASGSFTTLKASALASFAGGMADVSYSTQTLASGFSLTIGNGVTTLQLTPAGVLASGTITMPVSPGDGQWLFVTSTFTVTTCSFLPASGQTIVGAPTQLPAYVEMAFQYQAGSSRWLCQSGNDARVVANASSTSLLFGTSADGAAAITSGTTTLARDMHYTNLTISGTGAINPAGWRIFVSGILDISAAAAGAIVSNGVTAISATTATGAASPGGLSQRTVGQSPVTGGAGGNGGTGPGAAGTAGASTTYGNGGNGGAAGGGGTGVSSGGAGAAGGSETVQMPFNTPTLNFWMPASNASIASGLIGGGGGGGGGDGTNAGGGGGSGGSFGGMVVLYARNIQRGTNATASLIQAKGSNGGNGASGIAGNAAGGGGGGGGGGGLIYIVTETLLGSAITNALDVSGGTGGSGGNGLGTGKGGTGGTGGSGGSVQIVNLFAPSFTSSAWNTAGTAGSTTSTSTGAAGGSGAQVRLSL